MTTPTTTPTLNVLAPYPRRAEDATADAILRFVLATAQTANHRMLNGPYSDGREAALAATAYWAIAATLIELRDADPDRADRLARHLWEGWEDGATVGEQTWEWRAETGVDPERVNAAWDAAMATRKAIAQEGES